MVQILNKEFTKQKLTLKQNEIHDNREETVYPKTKQK